MDPNEIQIEAASFDVMVKQDYQGYQKLQGTARLKTGVVGKSHKFFKIGAAEAVERGAPSSPLPTMDKSYEPAECVLTDYVAAEYSDIFFQKKITFDEKAALVKKLSTAIGRKIDALQIAAMNSGANSSAIPATFGPSSGFSIEKLVRLSRNMNDFEVPDEGRHLAVASSVLEQALLQDKLTSADFNTVRALMNGELGVKTPFMGFKWHIMGVRLPKSGTTTVANTCIAWHEDAVGVAVGMDVNTDIKEVAANGSWLVRSLYSGGSVVIDSKGVFKMICNDPAAKNS
jgi:hypothetical protein